jgi:2-oxoisovalerate ferredoxin oxidoreductase alpha subunit
MAKQFVMGNEAIVYGALLGGATHFFGYPITPASEIAHAAASLFPASGRFFLQAESEVSVVNMMYGAASAGARTMTATSGPGLSLMAEGLSYLAGAELPSVIVNVQRAGPGLGFIWPEQSDYNAVVKGGGHGNYHNIVLAPNSVQELCDCAFRAFEIADAWRTTVIILSDACISQMMEPLELPSGVRHGARKEWAVYGDRASRENLVTSIYATPETLSDLNARLQEKYRAFQEHLVDYEETETADAEVLLVAFGISARIALSAVRQLRKEGCKAGLFRPKTLFPFPKARLEALAPRVAKIVVVELNNGQMAEDVELAVKAKAPTLRYNWYGGIVPTAAMIADKVIADMKSGQL